MSDWRTWRPDAPHLFQRAVQEILRLRAQNADLLSVLNDLVRRCDGEEGMRSDSSNIDTQQAHRLLQRLEEEES